MDFLILPGQFRWTKTITPALYSDMYAVDSMPINDHPQRGRFKIVPRDAMSFAVGSQGVETAGKDAADGPAAARSGG